MESLKLYSFDVSWLVTEAEKEANPNCCFDRNSEQSYVQAHSYASAEQEILDRHEDKEGVSISQIALMGELINA